MREYGSVSPRFWTGETGKQLRQDPQAQVLALYLMTSPHSNMLGVYYCPVMYMAHETGLGMEGASKALARLIEAGFCKFDEACETVFVIKMASFQVGASLSPDDKRVIGVRREVEKMACSTLKAAFVEVYSEAFHLNATEVQKASSSKAPSKPLLSQEQEQEQEQDKKREASPQAPQTSKPAAQGSRLPADWTLPAEWKTWATQTRPDLNVETVAEGFRDYWVAKPGKDGRKSDWQATWRNWIRNTKVQTTAYAKPAEVGGFV